MRVFRCTQGNHLFFAYLPLQPVTVWMLRPELGYGAQRCGSGSGLLGRSLGLMRSSPYSVLLRLLPSSSVLCHFSRPLQGDTCKTGKKKNSCICLPACTGNELQGDWKCQVIFGTCSALICFPRASVISFLHYLETI